MSKQLKNTLIYSLGLLLGGSLLYLALRKADFAELWQMLRGAAWLPLVGALLAVTAAHWVRALRWSMLLRAANYPVPANRTFAALMMGYMVNYAVPRLGEVTRCSILIKTNRTPLAISAGTVVTERVVDVLTLGLCVLLVLSFELQKIMGYFSVASNPFKDFNLNYLLAGLAILGLGVLLVMRFRRKLMRLVAMQKLAAFLNKLVDGLLSIRYLKKPWLFIFYSLLIWAGYILSLWCFMLAFPHTAAAGLWLAFILNTMGAIGMTLPVPGGLGPFHAAITYTMVLYGFTETQGANIALVMHTSQLVINILLGAAGYAYLLFQKPSPEEVDLAESGD